MKYKLIRSHPRVVVVGSGIAGCSTLNHLTREARTDVVLVERDELTSGSTWHAPTQVTQFCDNQTMVALKPHHRAVSRTGCQPEASVCLSHYQLHVPRAPVPEA